MMYTRVSSIHIPVLLENTDVNHSCVVTVTNFSDIFHQLK